MAMRPNTIHMGLIGLTALTATGACKGSDLKDPNTDTTAIISSYDGTAMDSADTASPLEDLISIREVEVNDAAAEVAEDVGPKPSDTAPEVAPEVIEDTAAEVIEDTAPEVIQDTVAEVIEDTAPEVIQDTAAEVIEDTAPEVVEDTDTQDSAEVENTVGFYNDVPFPKVVFTESPDPLPRFAEGDDTYTGDLELHIGPRNVWCDPDKLPVDSYIDVANALQRGDHVDGQLWHEVFGQNLNTRPDFTQNPPTTLQEWQRALLLGLGILEGDPNEGYESFQPTEMVDKIKQLEVNFKVGPAEHPNDYVHLTHQPYVPWDSEGRVEATGKRFVVHKVHMTGPEYRYNEALMLLPSEGAVNVLIPLNRVFKMCETEVNQFLMSEGGLDLTTIFFLESRAYMQFMQDYIETRWGIRIPMYILSGHSGGGSWASLLAAASEATAASAGTAAEKSIIDTLIVDDWMSFSRGWAHTGNVLTTPPEEVFLHCLVTTDLAGLDDPADQSIKQTLIELMFDPNQTTIVRPYPINYGRTDRLGTPDGTSVPGSGWYGLPDGMGPFGGDGQELTNWLTEHSIETGERIRVLLDQ